MKKLFYLLLGILLLSSCTNELITTENQSLSNQQLKQEVNYFDRYLARSSNLKSNNNSNIMTVDEELKLANQETSELLIMREKFRSNQKVELSARKNSTQINVPDDYPTLQEAIDNSQPNGKIVVKGNIEITEIYLSVLAVVVDVPGLVIVGENNASISGGYILVTAENIEISNLKLNVELMIRDGGSGAKILNNSFSSSGIPNNWQGEIILLSSVSNCIIKDNIINDDGGYLIRGINSLAGSNNNFISNTISGGDNTLAHIRLNYTSNNLIKDCTLINGGVPLSGSAISIFSSNPNTGNIITGCTISNINYYGINIFGGPQTNVQIVNCTIKGYLGFGMLLDNVSQSIVKSCVVNNKDYDPDETFDSVGIQMAGNDNTIANCNSEYNNWGGIVLIGYSSGNGSINKITDSKANNNKDLGIFYIGFAQNSTAIINNSEANNNTDLEGWGSIFMFSNNINSTYTVSNCKINNNSGGCSAGLIGYAEPGNSPNWTFKSNEVNNNFVGIYLENSTMATIKSNVAMNNSECDFIEVNNSGTALRGNQFGTSCVGLICN